MRRPNTFEKSPPFIWHYVPSSKELGVFFKFLWPSQNIWVLLFQGVSVSQFNVINVWRKKNVIQFFANYVLRRGFALEQREFKAKHCRNVLGQNQSFTLHYTIYIIKTDVCLRTLECPNVTSPPVLKLWDSQGYLWLPYDLTEVINLIGVTFKPKIIIFFKKILMSFLPH